jgi:hypothetical protein
MGLETCPRGGASIAAFNWAEFAVKSKRRFLSSSSFSQYFNISITIPKIYGPIS